MVVYPRKNVRNDRVSATQRATIDSVIRYFRVVICVFVIMQTEGVAGPQAELRALCHGEGRQQGHVHQEHRGQRSQ